jgi:hypothetical protein
VKSVADLIREVNRTCPPTVGVATTLPVPAIEAGSLVVTVLHFGQPVLRSKELVYPPRQCTVLDANTGQVLRHEPCSPATFGIDEEPFKRHTSFGLKDVPDDVFWQSRARIAEISPTVWARFFDRARGDASSSAGSSEDDRALAADYLSLFDTTTYKPLVPYLRAVAPAFFAWLEAEANA